MRRIVLWQPVHSPHQFALINALSRHEGQYDVVLVVSREVGEMRAGLNWGTEKYEHVQVHQAPSPAEIDLLVKHHPTESVHIFSGLEADAIGKAALNACIRHGAKVAIMAESPTHQGPTLKGLATRVKYARLAVRYRRFISHLFTIGAATPRFYESVGFKGVRMVPFGYYIDHPRRTPAPREGNTVRLLFVGRASPAKGGELLLNALAQVSGDWHLTLVTQGPERPTWETQVSRLGLSDRVQFTDFEANEQVQQRMANSDLLILPNTGKEGWGAVVNEALLQGTPVLCTTWTGAQDLVRAAPGGGKVVKPQLEDLKLGLQAFVDQGPRTSEMRATTSSWAQETISGAAAADLMVKSLLT
ncbi:glycosyltransferase family 4 protein [Deinococcus ficus]|nr:glycosyltransferase [Deinococcus ficus]